MAVDLKEAVLSGIAARMGRDPMIDKFVENEVASQSDDRVLQLMDKLADVRRSYDAERKQLIEDDNASDSHVVKKLEEERDLLVGTIKQRLARYSR